MSRKNIENVYPLSPLQEGMLFHTLYAEGEGAYVTQFDWAVRGSFDLDAFQRAFQQVVDRHAILRTFFTWEGLERPIQIVRKRAKLTVELQDLRALSPSEQGERLRRFADEDRRRGFDLTKAPAMRVIVFRLGDEHHRCFLSIHHIVIDGWSKSILIREVLSLYHAYTAGRELSLPPPTPYADFIAWLGKQDPAKAEGFFRQLLAGFSAPTPFGVDRPDQEGAGEGFEDLGFALSPEQSQEVSAFARAQGLTVNTVVQGTFAILLSRYSGEEDVLFGATVSGRSAPITGIDRMVGLFINAVPVRARLNPDEPVSAFLAALQVQQADIREYEHTPLVTVQGLSEVPRGTPLFESLVVFENFPVEESVTLEPAREGGGAGGKAGTRPASMGDSRVREHSNYPLTLMAAIGKQLAVQVSFDLRRFEPATIRRMLGHFQNLLEAILRAPGAPLAALSILGKDERKMLVEHWNATDLPYLDTATLHGLFEARVARAPEAPALLSEGRKISYRALNEEANRLAHHLRSLGAGQGTQVGICVERSPSMVVALLAVLKSGASYVPIDPAYPRERIALMIEISRLPILVTQTKIEGSLPVRGI
ncbi:MAG: condensation domain-containing protein, partial [Minicystis sp.]